MLLDDKTLGLASALLTGCRRRGLWLVTAESLTGGLIAATLTEIPGSSAVVLGGAVTYSISMKVRVLGVGAEVIAREGVVSEAVARAMAEGALRLGGGEPTLALASTGVAGPGPDGEVPAGTVHVGCAASGRGTLHRACAFGELGRERVRLAAVTAALELGLEALEGS